MLFNLTGVLLALLLVPPQPEELRVLFIGNSYTYFNNLPRMLEALGESARPPVRFHTQSPNLFGIGEWSAEKVKRP